MRCFWRMASLALFFGAGGCAMFQPRDHFGAAPVSYDQLVGWNDDDHARALAVFTASCPILAASPREASSGSGLRVPAGVWRSLCAGAARIPSGNETAARRFFEQRFAPYRITNNGHERGLFTGYYEPLLYGSYKKGGDFIYPMYLPPPEMKNGGSSFTHAEIDNGALSRRGLELIWVDDPVMLFFAQIQGSCLIRLRDGRQILAGYAGRNGRPYASLGKIVGDEGIISKDRINFFSLRQWLYDHHQQAFNLMERNPSYVFFRPVDAAGPIGAAGSVLTPGRSLAVDSRYIPYGLPLFLETELPSLRDAAARVPFNRLMIAQDTGGAIRSPVRGDIFFGEGGQAEYLAGYMRNRGTYSLLVPREITGQLQ
ncbi:MAG: MltA domain-containing protein [Pseudomonadota bacterium]|nr:MltA domain-containing protein [Pseudomonadota bacterium]